jgi:hypothetical protein
MSIRVRLISAQETSTTAETVRAMAAWAVPVLRTNARSSGDLRSKALVVIDRLELCGSRNGADGGLSKGAGGAVAAALSAAPPSTASSEWRSSPSGGTPLSDEEVPF